MVPIPTPAAVATSFSVADGPAAAKTWVAAPAVALRDGVASLAADGASVLVVNGALGLRDSNIDRYAVSFGGDGVALECAAKSKLAGLLAERLRGDGVFVGEVVINGSIKGFPYASPTTIDPVDVAARLWDMSAERTETRRHLTEQS